MGQCVGGEERQLSTVRPGRSTVRPDRSTVRPDWSTVRSGSGAVGQSSCCCRSHVAGVCQWLLDDEGINAILNPTEHLWDIVYSYIHLWHTTPLTDCPGAQLIPWCRSGQRRPRRPSAASSEACLDVVGHTGNHTQHITSCPEEIYRSWITYHVNMWSQISTLLFLVWQYFESSPQWVNELGSHCSSLNNFILKEFHKLFSHEFQLEYFDIWEVSLNPFFSWTMSFVKTQQRPSVENRRSAIKLIILKPKQIKRKKQQKKYCKDNYTQHKWFRVNNHLNHTG